MIKVLIFLSAWILFLGGSFVKADPASPAFVQTESNIESVEEDLNPQADEIGSLPLTTRPFVDFNIFNLMAPPTAATPSASKTMVRVNIFPVLDYKTKGFMAYMPGDGWYHKTSKFDGIVFKATKGNFHLSTLDGKIIGDGQELSFDLKKNIFILDHKTGPFLGLVVSQESDEATEVDWKYLETTKCDSKNPSCVPKILTKTVKFYYPGQFVVTREMTPRNIPTVKVVNIVDLERYVSAVLPNELPSRNFKDEARPEVPIEAMAEVIRTYTLGKVESRTKLGLDFDLFASTQDQLYKLPVDVDLNLVPEDSNVLAAVKNSEGKVIFYNDHIAGQVMYSANCAGRSVSYQDYSLGRSQIVYLSSVAEKNREGLRKLSTGTTVFSFTTQELADELKKAGTGFRDAQVIAVEPLKLNSSERATSIRFRGPTDFKDILPSDKAFSVLKRAFIPYAVDKKAGEEREFRTYMEGAIASGNHIILSSHGYGHNVGFCQEGAVLMVKAAQQKGKVPSADQIVTFYFKNTKIQKVNPASLEEVFRR